MTRYGGADLYCTEYFRVHPDSRLNPHILASITEKSHRAAPWSRK
ncbi:MAG: hypothetical protein WDN28_30295 [Chthoniobacter sp.]